MRIIEMIEYGVSVVVFACFVGVLMVLAVDVITAPSQLITATAAVRMPTDVEKALYIAELRSRDDDNSRRSVAVMEEKMRRGQ
jgi:hypothetical protein